MSVCWRERRGVVAAYELCSQHDVASVARVAQRRLGVVGDDLRHRVERVLPDVELVVRRQLNGNVMDAIRTQHRQRVRTSGLHQSVTTSLHAQSQIPLR